MIFASLSRIFFKLSIYFMFCLVMAIDPILALCSYTLISGILQLKMCFSLILELGENSGLL